ncbi:Ldb17p [Saccharomyces eubayanus]|uniref:Ldb17p n=1 Tax=Saccharomyces eubayanus TaxID=1080349 RepID=UPI0006C6A81F|nr:LDB17-like protein [Saccharomyces eubayanus]KOH00227.1 LDB17-like protein [Saccharomyces eubayanus]
MILDPLSPNIENHSHDEIIDFWEKIESIANIPKDKLDESHVNSSLVAYLKFATDSYKVFINTDRDLYRMSLILLESPLFEFEKEFCLSKLQSLLNIDLLEMNMKFIIVYVLLCEAKKNVHSLEIMLKFQGFTVFYNALYTQFAYLSKYGEEKRTVNKQRYKTDAANTITPLDCLVPSLTDIDLGIIDEMKQISTVLMDLLFQILKYCKCVIANLQIVDDFFVYFLMETIRSDIMDDMFNNAQFKLLLALNEQYMMFAKEYEIENKVYKYLINESVSKCFSELLLLKFNRVSDPPLQIMMCKIIYLILTPRSDHAPISFFYTNDLHVLTDVLIRELQNISEDEEILRNTLLRVLIPLLKNTQLSKTHYRKDDLNKLLQYLSTLDNICADSPVLHEHLVTVRLSQKCLQQIPWLEDPPTPPNENSPASSNATSRDSSIFTLGGSDNQNALTRKGHLYSNRGLDVSAESLTKRKARAPPPPPPPSRKCGTLK